MSFLQKIIGYVSGNGVEVDSNNQLKVALSNIATQMGGIRNFSENDPGTITGNTYLKSPETSTDYRLRVGIDTILFEDNFNAVTQNTSIWRHVFSTQTMTQSGGFLNINANFSTLAGSYCSLQTNQTFSIVGSSALYVDFIAAIADTIQANQKFEFGLFYPSAASIPTDGMYIRLTSAGLELVSNYNGLETTSGIISGFTPVVGENYHVVLSITETETELWVDDVLMVILNTPTGNAQPFIAGSLPFSVQSINTGTVAGTPASMKMGNVQITLGDLNNQKSYPAMQSGKGFTSAQGQNGNTQGQTAQWSNTAQPTAGTATNTTAALGSGIGGLFKANAMATSATDIIICSFQNPNPTANITGRNLYIRGVWVDVVNQVVPVATTPFTFAMAIAYGHTAVSLATVESASFATATTKAPRKIPLGFLHLPIGAVDGEQSRMPIYIKFETPIVVYPSQFFAICAKVLNGTATATETLLFMVGIDGFWE